jgi:type I restriction enzyme S subunit
MNSTIKMTTKAQVYLQLIKYSAFNLWDVKRYNSKTKLSFENVVRLRDILQPFKKAITKDEMIEKKWRIISKINFGGKLFLRDFDEIHTYKGNCNLVPDNAIIYSKINVRHGCIYYHEKGKEPFGVSNEYPTYTFDEKKVNGYFLQKLLRSQAFKTLLNSKTTGISKARVKQDEFLDIEIPLPSISEQNRIISNYYKKIDDALILETKATELEKQIDEYLDNTLGIENLKGAGIKKGLQTISYTLVDKWSLDDIFKKNTITSNKYNLVNLNSVCSLITDGTHQTPTYFKDGVIFLSAKNVTKEVIDWDSIKYVSKEAHNEYCKRVKPEIDDILLAKNGTTGVAAIIDVEREFSIYVSLALLKPIKKIIVPKFLLYVINSKIARNQFFSRLIGIGVPNLHLGEIKEVLIPLPPILIQQKIVQEITNMKNDLLELNKKILTGENLALSEFEKEIFH